MATVKVSAPLRASAEAVWELIGDFAALADWHPLVPNSRPTPDGQGRIITLPGAEVDAPLLPGASPPQGHTSPVGAPPLPLTDYQATLRLEATATGCTFVYLVQFSPAGVSEARAEALLRGFFEAGFTALQARLDTSEP